MTGKELKIARVTLDMSQIQLADAIGITQNTISRYETGTLPIPRLVEIAVTCLVERAEKRSES